MKSLRLKGFTLIECIVAMAIIGVASMLIAQVYGAVAIMNRNNAHMNTTLVEQMKMAERGITFKTDADLGGMSVAVEDYGSGDNNTVRKFSYADSLENGGTTKSVSKSSGFEGLAFEVDQVGKTGSFSSVGSGYTTNSNSFKIVSDGSGAYPKADIELVILKAKPQTDTVSGKQYRMDTSIRYKFMLSKTAANQDLIDNWDKWSSIGGG